MAAAAVTSAGDVLEPDDVARTTLEAMEAERAKRIAEYEETLANPWIVAERGYVDAVIPPSHTRGYVATALKLLERKVVQTPPKKHGNIPL